MRYLSNTSIRKFIKKGTIIVDFYADWCAPCKRMEPILEKINSKLNKAKMAKINIEKYPEVASWFGVTTLPTIIVWKNGETEEFIVGYKGIQELTRILKKYF